MSFAISGFGAQQYRASPQIFQALALGGSRPLPARQPFGSPNQDLVPVRQSGSGPLAGLSLQAAPIAAAIEALQQPETSQRAPSVAAPALVGSGSPTTGFSGARNTNVIVASGPPSILDGVYGGIPPEGVVAFNVRTPVVNGAQLIADAPAAATVQSAPAQHSAPAAQPAPRQAAAVAQIVRVVKNLAVAAVYPQPIFSFAA